MRIGGSQEFLDLFQYCPLFIYRTARASRTYQAHLWGPDIKRYLNAALGEDWHTYEADTPQNASRIMHYVLTMTEDGCYVDVLIKFQHKELVSRAVDGTPVAHGIYTLSISFRVARCRRAPVEQSNGAPDAAG